MKIINKVTDSSYIQWIEKFVQDVLDRAQISCNEVVIEDIEPSRNIFLTVDGEEYDIRTWEFQVVEKDTNGIPCAEMVRYSLFEMVKNEHDSHGEEVNYGTIKIEWKN